jgi:hypothetical protein
MDGMQSNLAETASMDINGPLAMHRLTGWFIVV